MLSARPHREGRVGVAELAKEPAHASDVESVIGIGGSAAWHARALIVARAAPCSRKTPERALHSSGHNGEATVDDDVPP